MDSLILPRDQQHGMLNLVTSALAFNGPSTVLTTTKRAPSASMAGSLEYDFVYGSAAGNAKPMGYGKHDSDTLKLKSASAYASQFSKFAYDSAALGDGKGDVPLTPTTTGKVVPAALPIPSLEQEFVYAQSAGNAVPLGAGKGN